MLGVLLATFYIVFTVVRIDGHSMTPTLLHADRVLVTRGYAHAERGDIVSIVTVEDGQRVDYVKRVIGVPGDEVEYHGDVAYINGEPSTVAPHAIISTEDPVTDPFTVPEGQVVVLGDNRPVSLDSRFIGPVPLTAVQGRVVAVILPLTRFTVIDDARPTP